MKNKIAQILKEETAELEKFIHGETIIRIYDLFNEQNNILLNQAIAKMEAEIASMEEHAFALPQLQMLRQSQISGIRDSICILRNMKQGE